MKRFLVNVLLFLVTASVTPSLFAIDVPDGASALGANDRGDHRAEAKLVFDHEEVAPGQTFQVGVLFELDPEWHVYGEDPGDSGLPTEVVFEGEGVTFGPLQYPPPEKFVDAAGIITTYGYEHWVLFVSEATVGEAPPSPLQIDASVSYLACKIKCLPGNAELTRALPVGSPRPVAGELAARFDARKAPPATRTATVEQPTEEAGAAAVEAESPAPTPEMPLVQVLLLAFLGGILLNLMPCVFPVLALKVFGFVSTGRAGRREALQHAGLYAGGILVSMGILSAAVLALRAGGEAVGWGFQFQEPIYVAILALVVTAFALNLFGVFDVPMMPVPSVHTGAIGDTPPVWRSFVDGVFAVVLATPCSAPFLGTAVGFALASDAPTIVAAFLMVGVGLAAPYVLASSWPALARRLPEPGPWMETFERILGFLLLGTSVWLVWVYGRLADVDAVAGLLVVALAMAVAVWIWGKTQYSTPRRKLVGFLSAALLIGAAWTVVRPDLVDASAANAVVDVEEDWAPFDEDEIARAQAAGQVVFVDFTADWCITCKVNERTVLAQDAVWNVLTGDDVLIMKADWTRRDDRIREVLARFGRAGVPMYLVYPAGGGEPEVLPEVLTPDIVLAAIDRAR